MTNNTEFEIVLPYDPGVLPTLPTPSPGTRISFDVAGLPPPKDLGRSIRNRSHPLHGSFLALRKAATAAMAGRAWTFGPVGIKMTIYGPRGKEARSLGDYLGGVCDTLDGSSGFTFTFLPIVFEDDSQVSEASFQWIEANEHKYHIEVLMM